MACATRSFPVPLSPKIRTGAPVPATFRTELKTSFICRLVPSIPSNPEALTRFGRLRSVTNGPNGSLLITTNGVTGGDSVLLVRPR